MTSKWVPEPDEEQPKPLEHQVKAHIALEDSDGRTWGIAKDIEDNFLWKPGEGSVVGTWSRSPQDNLIHVFLETPLQALQDKAVARFVEYAERRRVSLEAIPKKTRAPKTPKVAPEPDIELVGRLSVLDGLRKSLGH